MIPSKVEAVRSRIERSGDWGSPVVEQRDGLWIVRARAGEGSVFTERSITVYIGVSKARTIEGTDIRMRASQRLQGGHVTGFMLDRKIRTWRDLRVEAPVR